MRPTSLRRGRAALAALLGVTLAFSASPLAYAAGSGAGASGDASSETSGQERWSDCIDEMLAAGDFNEGKVIAIVAPSVADSGAAMATSDDGEGASGFAAGSLLDESSEELSRTTGDVYEETFDEALPAQALEGAQAQALAASGGELAAEPAGAADVDVYTLVVSRDDMTTEEILRSLADDPRVLWAEPDRVVTVPGDEAVAALDEDVESALCAVVEGDGSAAGDAGDGLAVSDAGASSSDSVTSVSVNETQVVAGNDVTDWQWAYSDAEGAFGDKHADGLTVNLDGWNDAGEKNSSGVVAVMDTGIDVTNPDLDDVMYDMSPLVSAVGGGTYGYCALEGADEAEVFDANGHGTHCAGIIAAEWNGSGVSGAANGAQLLAVRTGDANGGMSTSSIVRGYAYLERAVDAGVDLRVVSNSWGSIISERSVWLCVQSLGRKGAVSVFAAGNETIDLDTATYTGKSMLNLPYALVVSSADMSGSVSSFSNYGATSSSVFAPGSGILSTASSASAAKPKGVYLPQALDEEDQVVLETFDSEDCGIQAYLGVVGDPLKNPPTVKVGHVEAGAAGFGDKGIYKISAKELLEAGGSSFCNVSFKIPVDEGRLSELSDFSVAIGAEGSNGATGTVGATVYGLTGAGAIVKLGGMKSITSSSNESWTQISLNTTTDLATLGDGAGLAVFKGEDGQSYIWFNVTVNTMACGSDGNILIDLISGGNKTVPYLYMSGTSMATPCVSGLAMVAAEQIEGYAEMGKAERAAELVGVLKGSVNAFDGQFSGKCASNGMIDAGKFASAAADSRAPVITSVELSEDERTFVLRGTGFGDEAGAVSVSGADAEVVSWSATEIVASRPAGVVSSYLKFSVARADGASCRMGASFLFTKDVSPDEVPLFEETIELPAEFDDYPQYSTMAALDGSIYVFPYVDRGAEGAGEDSSASYKHVWRYDTEAKSWSRVADMPGWVAGPSITLWDGKLLVMASAPTEGNGGLAGKRLYRYDPQTGAWADLSDKVADDSVPYQAALVNVGDRLLVVGGSKLCMIPADADEAEKLGVWVPMGFMSLLVNESYDVASPTLLTLAKDNVRELDLDAGTARVVGSCKPRSSTGDEHCTGSIQTALCGDKLYLYGGAMVNVTVPSVDTDQTVLECLTLGEDGSVSASDVGDFSTGADASLPKVTPEYMLVNALAATKAGPVLTGVVGAENGDFIQEDTYVLADGSEAFAGFGKRVNNTPTTLCRAVAYRGRLYVIGHDFDIGNGALMRATAVETDELPGDVAREPEPSPAPEPSPTPEPSPAPEPGKTSGSGTKASGGGNGAAAKSKLPATGDNSLLGALARLFG